MREQRPNVVPATIARKADADAPVAVGLGREGNIYVNGYTGAILGAGSQGTRDFFRSMTDWHRWLAMSGEKRATGRAITGASNALFLFIVISGFYLWFPRKWNWAQFRNVMWFKRRLPSKARDFNWHNVIGFWSVVPLFVIVLSGVVISYPFAGNMVYRVVGEQPPAPQRPGGGGPGGPGGPEARVARRSWPCEAHVAKAFVPKARVRKAAAAMVRVAKADAVRVSVNAAGRRQSRSRA